MKITQTRLSVLFAAACCFLDQSAHANPLGGVVVGGSANISGQGTPITTIQQNSDRAIINWQDFSIGLGELTRFLQPGANSAVLNRVMSGNPSQLLGTLQANGQVFLINPNGIFVGPSGQVNAATFVASTLDLANVNFMAGGNLGFSGNSTAGIQNLGTINALGGDIFMFAHTVNNSGTLKAESGTVGLAAGVSLELYQSGNERIGVLVGNSSAPQAAVGVNNTGLIKATSAEIKAAGGNIYAVAINNGGVIRAEPTLVTVGGKIILKSDGGTVINSGTLDASNNNPGGQGGDIQVLGQQVGLAGTSVVNANGAAGGGKILIGGDFHGANPSVLNAQQTYVGAGAVISADAVTTGSGGQVVVWSDEITRYFGSITAKGGAQSGNGGSVEVSGKNYLSFDGQVDVSSAHGLLGSILLDPRNLTIQAVGANDGTPVGNTVSFSNPDTLTDVTISAAVITGLAGNVVLQAYQDLTINAALAFTQNSGQITFQAGRNLTIGATVSTAGSALSFTANDAGGLRDGTGTLAINSLVGSGATGAVAFNNTGSGGITLGAAVTSASTINFNAPVILGAGVTLTGTTVSFGSSVNGAHTLAVNGNASLSGAVGTGVNLTSLNVSGTTTINAGAGAITTTGAQTYTSAISLGADTTLTGNTIGITGGTSGAANLTITDSGTTTIGASIAANSLTINGGGLTHLNGGSVITTAGQSYGNAITLGATTTLTGTSISLNNTVAGGTHDLTLTGSGLVTIGNAITGVGNLNDVGAGTTTINTTTITTSANQNYQNPVTLGNNVVLTGVGVTFNSSATITGVNNDLTIHDGSTTTFGAAVSGLHSLTTDAPVSTAINGGSIGALTQNYQGPVSLGANTTLTGITVTFSQTIAGGGYSLNLVASGVTTFGGVVSGVSTLVKDQNGTTIINGGSVTTTGSQSFNDPVTLGNDTTLTGTDISLAAVVGGGHNLILSGTGTTTLNGSVTGLASLTSGGGGTTVIKTSAITTTGDQTYNNAVTLQVGTTLTGVNGTFASINGGNNDLALNFSGPTLINATISNIHDLSTGNGGTTTIAANVTTTGTQTYSDATLLSADVNLTGTTVHFGNLLDSQNATPRALTVTGNAQFDNFVGSVNQLASVHVTGQSILNGGNVGFATVKTSTTQNYDNAVTLGANTTLTGTSVSFGGTVNGTGAATESLLINGAAVFGGFVGNLASLTTVQVTGASTFNAGDTGAATVNTSGTQNYIGAVTLGADTSLTGTTVTFGNTVNGGAALTVTGRGVFAGYVGNLAQVTSVHVTGTSALNAGNASTTVNTSGNQNYDGNVTLGANTTLSGGTVSFGGTVNGGAADTENLRVNGNAVLGGYVGNTARLTTLRVTGTTALNAGNASTTVNTQTTQNYDGAVTLGGNTTLAGSLVTFGTTVDSSNVADRDLTVSGNAAFGGYVGSGIALNTLHVTGLTTLNAGATLNTVTTDNSQLYSGAVTLGADAYLYSKSGSITFSSTVNGAFNLSVDASVNSVFTGFVGNTAPLTTLEVVSGTTDLNAGNASSTVHTTGTQKYDVDVLLGANTTLQGSTITTSGNVNGAWALTVNGNAIFNGYLGNTATLASLHVTGTTAFNGGNNGGVTATVRTSGVQTYDLAATLGADTTLNTSTADFNSTLAGGNFNLTINGSGPVTFHNSVIALNNLTVSTVGAISGLADVAVAGTASLQAGAGNDISFQNIGNNFNIVTVPSAKNVTLVTANGLILGNVGNVAAAATANFQALSGAISQQASTTISANSLALAATTGIGTTLANMNTAVANLEAVTTTGGIFINNTGNLAIGGVSGALSGVLVFTSGDISLINAGSVSILVQNDGVNGPGNVTIHANGATANLLTGGTQTAINAGGVLTLSAGQDLLFGDIGTKTYGDVHSSGNMILTAGRHIVIDEGTYVLVDGPGNLSATAGGNISLRSTDVPDSEILTSGGTLTLTTGAGGTLSSATGGHHTIYTTNGGAAGNTITINADNFSITTGDTINAGTGTVIFTPVTASRQIDVGTVTGAKLSFTSAEINLIYANLIQFGGVGAGATTVSAAIAPANTANLEFLNNTTISGGSIITTGSQLYDGTVTLGADTALTATTATFTKAVDDAVIGTEALNITGNAVFDGVVGGGKALGNLTVSQNTTINAAGTAGAPSIITTAAGAESGNQVYGTSAPANTTTLGADVVLRGHSITFNSTVDSDAVLTPRSLIVQSGNGLANGITTFNGTIGGVAPLSHLETDADGETIIHTGNINLNGASAIFNDPVLITVSSLSISEAGLGNVVFNNVVDSATGAETLDVNMAGGGALIFNGAVGSGAAAGSVVGLGYVHVTASGTTQINGGIVDTTADQIYNNNVTLGNNATLTGTTVTFHGTVNAAVAGSEFLSIVGNAAFGDHGVTSANQYVGNTAALSSVSVSGLTTFDVPTSTSTTPTVNTTGGQTYTGAVTLNADSVFNSTGSGTIQFGSTVGGSSDDLWTLTINTAGTTQLQGGALGTPNRLLKIITDDPSAPPATLGGTTELTGTFNTGGIQTYNDAVILENDVTINVNLLGNVATTPVTFASTVDAVAAGTQSLTVNGDAIFQSNVGTTSGALRYLAVTGISSIGGNITVASTSGINGAIDGSITLGGAVTLTTDAVLTGGSGPAAGLNEVWFKSTVDGAHNLTVHEAGLTRFDGLVGDLTLASALTSLTVDSGTPGTPGALEFHAVGSAATPSVTTTGNQIYNDTITLNANTVLLSTTAGNIQFGYTVDALASGVQSLQVYTTGVTEFDGYVGSLQPLASLLVDDSPAASGTRIGHTHINSVNDFTQAAALGNTPNIHTTGNQTYNNDVVLAPDASSVASGDVLLQADGVGSTISFNQRIDGTVANQQGLKIYSDNSSVNQSLVGIQVQLEYLDISQGPNVGNQTISLTQDTQILAGNVYLGNVLANGHNLLITANGITFAGGANSVQPGANTADITLRPIDPTSSIGIAGGAGTFSLSSSDVLALAHGFRTITIGRNDGSGVITIDSVTFTDPVRIETPTGAGHIFVNGLLQDTAAPAEALAAAPIFGQDYNPAGNALIDVNSFNLGTTHGANYPVAGAGVLLVGPNHTTTLSANIDTTGTPIFINDSVILNTGVTLNTTLGGASAGANITVTGTINADLAINDQALTLNGGTAGNIDLQKDIGNTATLGSLHIVSAHDVAFNSAAATVGVNVSGQITIDKANNVTFNSVVNSGSILQSAGTGTTEFKGGVTTTGVAGVDLTTAAVQLDGITIDTHAGPGPVRINAPVTLTAGPVAILTGGGNISLLQSVEGAEDLTLNSGAGKVTVTGSVGDTAALGNLNVTTAGGDVLFSSSIDNNGIINIGSGAGKVTVTGTVGHTTAPTDVTVTTAGGDVTFSSSIDNSGNINISSGAGAVAVTGAIGAATSPVGVTVTTTGGPVTLSSTLDASGAVNITAGAGNVTVSGAIGNLTRLASLTVSGNNISLNNIGGAASGVTGSTSVTAAAAAAITLTGSTYKTTGSQAYNAGAAADLITLTGVSPVAISTVANPVTFTGALQLNNRNLGVTASTANFNGKVDGSGTLTVTGNSVFGAAPGDFVGSVIPVTSVHVTGATTFNAGNTGAATVDTTGSQNYDGNATLAANTTLTGSSLTFGGTVTGGFSLAANVSGLTTFSGNVGVGGAGALTSLTTDAAGTTAINGSAVTTSGFQTYNDDVTLGGPATGITSTGNAAVNFAKTVTGPSALTVTTGGLTTFGGSVGVGGAGALTSVTTDTAGTTAINGSAVTTSGFQTYNDDVTLGGPVTGITSTGNAAVNFAKTVTGPSALTVTTGGLTTFGGSVGVGGAGALTSVTTDTAGTTAINGSAVTTSGFQTYNDDVTLGGPVTGITSTGNAAVNFAKTVTGPSALTVTTGGLTTFGGSVGVGGAGALTSVTTDTAGTTAINGSAVTTSGFQTYNDNVTLGGPVTGITSTGNAAVNFAKTVTGPSALTVTTGGLTTFGGSVGVGGAGALTSVTTDAAGTTAINGSAVTTTGFQTYNDDVTLGGPVTGITSTGNAAVNFAKTVTGPSALTVTTGGLTTFSGNVGVGGAGALTSVTTDTAGTTAINGSAVTTSGFQTYNDDVTLGGPVTGITSTGNAAVNFAKTVTGPSALTVTTGGLTTFGGNVGVGGAGALTSVTTDTAGTTAINGSAVTTSGFQTYNDDVTLGGPATGITSTGNAAVNFAKTVTGASALTVTTGGLTTFGGNVGVGGAGALTSVTTDAAGTTAINGSAVTTSGFQTYNDDVTLGGPATGITSTGNAAVNFAKTVTGASALTVTTGGLTTFGGNVGVGGAGALTSLTTDAAGTTAINGSAVTTSGFQTYNDDVTLGGPATGITSTGNAAVNFAKTVTGASALTVTTGGLTTFGGNVGVGGAGALTSVTTDAAGTTAINGSAVTTTGFQTYNDDVTLGGPVTGITSTGNAAVTFVKTVTGPSALTVTTGGLTTFGGSVGVGGAGALTSVLTDNPGTTAINGGAVTTTGFQTFNDNVILGAANTVLTSTTTGDITIGLVGPNGVYGYTTLVGASGANTLVANSTANVKINAAISGVVTLNGTAGTSYIAPNPGNTGINLYYSTPASPYVFIYTRPPAQFRLNNVVFSVVGLFGGEVADLLVDPEQKKTFEPVSVSYEARAKQGTRSGILSTDQVLSNYDLADEDNGSKKTK